MTHRLKTVTLIKDFSQSCGDIFLNIILILGLNIKILTDALICMSLDISAFLKQVF